MLRRTRLTRVVFTEGFPFLEVFANRHFLPHHPLRHANMWLDENDFTVVHRAATARGLPPPFRIDPYAHHPTLSPYALTTSATARSPGKRSADVRARTNASRAGGGGAGKGAATAYRVPVCAATLYRHLHLFNADQMMLTDHRVLQDHNPSHRSDQQTSATAAPSDIIVADPALTLDVKQDGVRALHALLAMYPTSRSMHYNIATKKPYYATLATALEQLRARHGFSQRWWGTIKQWTQLGATQQPGELDHIIAVPVQSKLVHISLLTNAEAVLSSSIIFAKSGVLHYHFRSSTPMLDQPPHESILTPAAHNTDDFFEPFVKDVRVHGYPVPLYVSASQIARQKWTLRPNAVGVSSVKQTLDATQAHDSFGIPDAVEELFAGDEGAIGRTTQSSAPPVGGATAAAAMRARSSLMVEADPEEDESADGARTATSASATRTRSVFFYHLSQVHFPDPFFLPPAVMTAELEHPVGTPIHGITGVALPSERLRASQLAVEQPQLAALLSQPPAGLADAPAAALGAIEAALRAESGAFLPLAPTLRPTAHAVARQQRQAQAQAAQAELEALLDASAAAAAAVGSAPPATSSASSSPASAPPPTATPASADHTSDTPLSDSHSSSGSGTRRLLKDFLADRGDMHDSDDDTAAGLAHFVRIHANPQASQGRHLWFLAADVLEQNGIVDVNATPIEVTVIGEEVVPGYRLGPHGLEPVSATSLSGFVDGAGVPLAKKRFFNVSEIEDQDAVFRTINTVPE